MLCALTVRKIKDGSFEDFRKAFMGLMEGGDPPEGWVRFNMVRGVDDPNEVVCFGFFDGSIDVIVSPASTRRRSLTCWISTAACFRSKKESRWFRAERRHGRHGPTL